LNSRSTSSITITRLSPTRTISISSSNTVINTPTINNALPLNPNSTSPITITRVSPTGNPNKKCKCGSSNHFRTTHKDCPLNKTRNSNVNEFQNKCAHCGSSDHRRKSNYRCPFNQRNLQLNIVYF
jgi:hypothetical protein